MEQFILDNGRPPLRTDFKKKCLPPHSVIKRRFGLTLQEWPNQNYPTGKTPLDELHAQATQDFTREYLRTRPVSAEDYNARQAHSSRRWRILLEKLNLPIYNNRGVLDSTPQLKVRVISDYNFEDDNPSDWKCEIYRVRALPVVSFYLPTIQRARSTRNVCWQCIACVNLLPTCVELATDLLKLATYLLLAIKLASGSKIAIPVNAPSIFNPSYNRSYK